MTYVEPMDAMNKAFPRGAIASSYAGLVLLPCLIILLVEFLPHLAVVGMCLAYAFALLPTWYLDHWLLGGAGFHSLEVFVLLALLVAAMLWPLALLAAKPWAWRSKRWRGVMVAYGAAFIVYMAGAVWWMLRSGGEKYFG